MAFAKGIAVIELLGIGIPIIVIGAIALLYIKGVKKTLSLVNVTASSTLATFTVTNLTANTVSYYPVIAFTTGRFQGPLSTLNGYQSGTVTVSYAQVQTPNSYVAGCNDSNNTAISNSLTGNI